MTYEQIKQLNRSGRFTASPGLAVPSCPEFEPHPQPEDNIAHQEEGRPFRPDDSNGLSISDSAALHDLRYSDPLHKADKVAGMYERGKDLTELASKEGTAQFSKRYKK